MKELLVKTKPLKPGIDFDNFHVAMSKNGGLVAFVKKSSYFIMDSSNPIKTVQEFSVRTFQMNIGSDSKMIKRNKLFYLTSLMMNNYSQF